MNHLVSIELFRGFLMAKLDFFLFFVSFFLQGKLQTSDQSAT